jgi:hypothetical protein
MISKIQVDVSVNIENRRVLGTALEKWSISCLRRSVRECFSIENKPRRQAQTSARLPLTPTPLVDMAANHAFIEHPWVFGECPSVTGSLAYGLR